MRSDKPCDPGNKDRFTGAANEKNDVALRPGDTVWDLAGEKYCVSGSDQLAATLAVLDENGIKAKVGTRNGKKEWIAEPYQAGHKLELPAKDTIAGLSSKSAKASNSVETANIRSAQNDVGPAKTSESAPVVVDSEEQVSAKLTETKVNEKPAELAAKAADEPAKVIREPLQVEPAANVEETTKAVGEPAKVVQEPADSEITGLSVTEQVLSGGQKPKAPDAVLIHTKVNDTRRLGMQTVAAESAPPNEHSRAVNFARGVVHGIVETPINGLTQLVNHATDNNINLPELHLVTDSTESAFQEGTAFQAGNITGSIVPLYLIYRAVGKQVGNGIAAEKTAELLGTRTVGQMLKHGVKHGGTTGAIYDGVFQPVVASEGNFWEARARNAATGALTMSILTGGNAVGRHALMKNGIGGSASLKGFVTKELPANTVLGITTGTTAGAIDAHAYSLLKDGTFASTEDMNNEALAMGAFGGLFSAVGSVHQRVVRGAKITPQQAETLRVAKLSEGQSGTWIKSYVNEFPELERQDIGALKEHLKSGRMHMFETRAQNGRLVSWNLVEQYPGKTPAERDFYLNCYLATYRPAQGIGLGKIHMPKAMEAMRTVDPKAQGVATEIELPQGGPKDQTVRRAGFYSDLDFERFRNQYYIPLFPPEGEYIPQRQIPGDGPIPAHLLFTPFQKEPITAAETKRIIQRIYEDGYGIRANDPFMKEVLDGVDPKAHTQLVPLEKRSSAPASKTGATNSSSQTEGGSQAK